MKRIRHLCLLLLMPIAACAATPSLDGLAAPSPAFSPQAFFDGDTVGEGTLRIVLRKPVHTHVLGRGSVGPDGALVLVQTAAEGDAPARERTWTIRPTGGGRFTGTLTDAEGPIRAEVRGNLLHLRFMMREGGLDTEQWLYLQPGGQVALNRMVVRKFGIPVASLEETIARRP